MRYHLVRLLSFQRIGSFSFLFIVELLIVFGFFSRTYKKENEHIKEKNASKYPDEEGSYKHDIKAIDAILEKAEQEQKLNVFNLTSESGKEDLFKILDTHEATKPRDFEEALYSQKHQPTIFDDFHTPSDLFEIKPPVSRKPWWKLKTKIGPRTPDHIPPLKKPLKQISYEERKSNYLNHNAIQKAPLQQNVKQEEIEEYPAKKKLSEKSFFRRKLKFIKMNKKRGRDDILQTKKHTYKKEEKPVQKENISIKKESKLLEINKKENDTEEKGTIQKNGENQKNIFHTSSKQKIQDTEKKEHKDKSIKPKSLFFKKTKKDEKTNKKNHKDTTNEKSSDSSQSTAQEVHQTLKEDTIDDDVKKVLLITDKLLEQLPDAVIDEFAQSDDFTLYEKVISRFKAK